MFTCAWILGIVVCCAATRGVWGQHYPAAPNITTCEEFERGTRFSPYALIDHQWKIFYFWSNNTELYPIIFSLAAKNRVRKFKDTFEACNPGVDVEWDKATLVMEPRPGTEIMMLYAGQLGAYRAIIKKEQRNKERPYPEPLFKMADVRMKLVSRVLGMMCCEDLTAYALIRVGELPKTEEQCARAASLIGYHGYEGRSYIYVKNLYKEEL